VRPPRRLPVFLPLAALGAASLASCSPYALMPPERLQDVATEELCARRGNLINGPQMERELRRRGADCTWIDKALLAEGPRFDLGVFPPPAWAAPGSLPPPVPYGAWRSSPEPEPEPEQESVPRQDAPWASGAEPRSAEAYGQVVPDGSMDGGGMAETEAPPPVAPPVVASPSPAAPPPAAAGEAAPAAAPQPQPPSPPSSAPRGTAVAAAGPTVAPLVTPGCAERRLRRGAEAGGEGADPARRAVVFRNTCAFPIRVRFAARPGASLSEVTDVLRPGETSAPARLADGFDHPGYVVCSYASVSERALCR
jgi:hypothetical protein